MCLAENSSSLRQIVAKKSRRSDKPRAIRNDSDGVDQNTRMCRRIDGCNASCGHASCTRWAQPRSPIDVGFGVAKRAATLPQCVQVLPPLFVLPCYCPRLFQRDPILRQGGQGASSNNRSDVCERRPCDYAVPRVQSRSRTGWLERGGRCLKHNVGSSASLCSRPLQRCACVMHSRTLIRPLPRSIRLPFGREWFAGPKTFKRKDVFHDIRKLNQI